jgi:hypothetical protein
MSHRSRAAPARGDTFLFGRAAGRAEDSPPGGKVHTGVVTQAGAGVRLVTAAQLGWLRTMSLPSAGSLLKTWHAQSPSHEVRP